MDMLRSCILRRDYKVPDDLNDSVVLSDTGKEVQLALAKAHKVNPKDARILCLLEYDHVDLLVDVENINLEALRESISRQILDRDIIFPFTFGRELYDKAATLFAHETQSLAYEDTMRLLEGTSRGVFQIQTLAAGPYGILESAETRWLMPTKNIPLFHCADITCDDVHHCHLSSDSNAPINVAGPRIVQVLNKISEETSSWQAFIADVANIDRVRYDDRTHEPLPFILGDGLSDRELRLLVSVLMDTTKGELRQRIAPLNIVGNAARAVESLSRAELMQIALLCGNDEIIDQIDRLVASDEIHVPAAEVRRPVVNVGYAAGAYGVRAELGANGVRFVPATRHVSQLRLRRLIDKAYRLDVPSDRAELEFQLRDIDSVSVESQLEEFIRSATPEQVLTRLVLARHANVIAASEDLAVDTALHAEDSDLIDSILWKLGFGINRGTDANRQFWRHHREMKTLTQTADVSAVVDQTVVRSLASNYFVALEGILNDSLSYSTWALTENHLAAQRPFIYRPDDDGPTALMALNEAEKARASREEHITFGGENELYALCRGFGILSHWLGTLLADQGQYLRPEAEYPPAIRNSDLRRFPFKHTVAFLDLTIAAQEHVPRILTEISRVLVAAKVSEVRNEWFHYRKSTADVLRLADCLSAIERAVNMLEREGFCRVQFVPVRDSGDTWGRRIYFLADSRGREIGIARPVRYDTSQMPGLRSMQYLMPAAVFAEPGEMLRFSLSVSSEYSALWDGYPTRRQEGKVPAEAGIPSDPFRVGGSSTASTG
ncbi:hypothetical protein [Kribbella sp. NPDC051620]|uniref:hypothetical protein n=1 Tax=Kribbella sp. NPDC051620 TaxID=3364120 RepID=UPI00379615A2